MQLGGDNNYCTSLEEFACNDLITILEELQCNDVGKHLGPWWYNLLLYWLWSIIEFPSTISYQILATLQLCPTLNSPLWETLVILKIIQVSSVIDSKQNLANACEPTLLVWPVTKLPVWPVKPASSAHPIFQCGLWTSFQCIASVTRLSSMSCEPAFSALPSVWPVNQLSIVWPSSAVWAFSALLVWSVTKLSSVGFQRIAKCGLQPAGLQIPFVVLGWLSMEIGKVTQPLYTTAATY